MRGWHEGSWAEGCHIAVAHCLVLMAMYLTTSAQSASLVCISHLACLQGGAKDVQQLRDAHGCYVAACQAACWQQGPASIAAAVQHILQATAAFVDSLASEGWVPWLGFWV